MQARATRKYIRMSPKKIRIVADVVRGMPVDEALSTLHFLPQKASAVIERTVRDAVANLFDQNEGVDEESLRVLTIMVDEAPVIKRYQPVSRGRAHPILKRSAHLSVVIGTAAEDAVEA